MRWHSLQLEHKGVLHSIIDSLPMQHMHAKGTTQEHRAMMMCTPPFHVHHHLNRTTKTYT